jgi:hypothetical protein
MTETMTRASKIIALLQEKVRLDLVHRRFLYLAFGILWSSGALWLVAEWFKEPDLGPTRTPLQSLSMKIHGAAMLFYLALLGTLWTHVRRGFALRANRLSGSLIIAVNVLLVLSGWILYYLADDRMRQWGSALHWTTGLAALPLLCAHVFLGSSWAAKLLDQTKQPCAHHHASH